MTEESFKWSDSAVCVAVYNTLEDDKGMDEFENEMYPFNEGGDTKISNMLFYLINSSSSHQVLAHVTRVKGIKFTRNLIKKYKAKYKVSGTSYEEIRDTVISMFSNPDTTLAEIAEFIDGKLILTK